MNNKKPKITNCECDKPGWCERHQCHKTAHMHKLCMYHKGYFELWEQCRGPNQNPSTCVPVVQKTNEEGGQKTGPEEGSNKDNNNQQQSFHQVPPKQQMPSLITQARNFIKSAAKHAASGFSEVPPEEYERRIQICQNCEFLTPEFRCAKCGCFMRVKAKWSTSSCPLGKW